MNLTPHWVPTFQSAGFQAVHWSDIGAVDANDAELLGWATDNMHIVMTSDLDFSTMLALSNLKEPSVIQLRSEHTLPNIVGSVVLAAIRQHENSLVEGAVLTIEADRHRVRVLPFFRAH